MLEWLRDEGEGEGRYRLNMSETISTSVSAAAIFSAEEGCARLPPPNMKDIVGGWAGGAGA